jgi:molecular chaperone HscB
MTDTSQPVVPLSAEPAVPSSAAAAADYFSVFTLPRKLALDAKALERAFYRQSREVHPDRFVNASPEKQQWSLQQTSLLNDAYRALKDPIARTEYLLQLEGLIVPDAARGGDAEDGKKQVPAALLAEVFELNMQLEEMSMNAKMGEDDPQLRSDLEASRTTFEAQFAQVSESITAQWSRWDAAQDASDLPAQRAAAESMAALLDKRRYLGNLVRDVRSALAPETAI